MQKPCPVCKSLFDESKLAEHLSRDHMDVADPEIEEMHHHHENKCILCGAVLPTPEALRAHNAQAHGL